MPSDLQVDNIKDGSATKTLATLSSSAVTLHDDVALPSGTMCGFTETTTTPSSSQGDDTVATEMTGSNVSYTPVASSSYVIYEYSTTFVGSDSNPLVYFEFHYDGGVVSNTHHAIYQPHGDGDANMGYKTWSFVLPSWTGAKTLTMKYYSHSSAYQCRLHMSSHSNGTSNDVFTKIYRRTYSVM